jgi:hypothetical protein
MRESALEGFAAARTKPITAAQGKANVTPTPPWSSAVIDTRGSCTPFWTKVLIQPAKGHGDALFDDDWQVT